jgi:hypothetical protein
VRCTRQDEPFVCDCQARRLKPEGVTAERNHPPTQGRADRAATADARAPDSISTDFRWRADIGSAPACGRREWQRRMPASLCGALPCGPVKRAQSNR